VFTLDANSFVRDVDIRDPHHATCHALLDALRLQRTPLICPQILLPEVAGAVRRTWQDALRGRLAAQFVGELPNLTLVAVDAALAQEAADLANVLDVFARQRAQRCGHAIMSSSQPDQELL